MAGGGTAGIALLPDEAFLCLEDGGHVRGPWRVTTPPPASRLPLHIKQ